MDLFGSPRRRTLVFAALYLSEGAPIGFLWWALPTILRDAGKPVGEITLLTSLLVLPWMFKALWAPVVDTFQTSRWTLRRWILTLQLLMAGALIPLLVGGLPGETSALAPVLLVHAILAATHDTAIDALVISCVPSGERGTVNGWMQAGLLLGRSLLGGGALVLYGLHGFQVVIALLIAVAAVPAVLLMFSGDPALSILPDCPAVRFRRVLHRLGAIARSRVTWWGLLFAGVGGAAWEGVGAVAGPYLLDHGLAPAEVGTFFGLYAVVAMGAGGVAGGWLADRTGKQRTVAASLGGTILCVAALAGLEWNSPAGPAPWAMPVLTCLYCGIGVCTAASYALFMEITEPEVGGTQFSAFMGATNACEAASAFAVGRMIPDLGYSLAFVVLAGVSLAALPIVHVLRPPHPASSVSGR